MIAGAVDLVMARAARPDRPRRRLRHQPRSPVRAAGGRGAGTAVGAARRVRGARQSRRRAGHDGGAVRRAGFTVLRDARTQIMVRGEPIDIAGMRYWTHRMPDIARVVRGASPTLILLAHTPKRLLEAAALSVPLLLSGHTHGGQIVLPGHRRGGGPRVSGGRRARSGARTRRSSSAAGLGPFMCRCASTARRKSPSSTIQPLAG